MAEKAGGAPRAAARPVSSRRSGRVAEKLQQKIRDKEYYEAHQTYRVLYQRYRAQGKEKEALDLLYDGALTLLQHGQRSSGSDLGLLMVEHLKEAKSPVTEELLEKITNIFSQFTRPRNGSAHTSSPPESSDMECSPSGTAGVFEVVPEVDSREALLRAALKWTNMVAEEEQWKYGHPKLHKMAANTYWTEGQYVKAREHFLYAEQPQEFGNMLVELSTQFGYSGEADLFIAQTVLQLLVLKDRKGGLAVFNAYTRKHPQFKSDNPPYLHHPTLNFIWFLLSACKDRSREVFQCLKVNYSLTINRDPSFNEYLDKISEAFFGPPVHQPQPPVGGSSSSGPQGGLFNLGAPGGLIEGIINSLSSFLPQQQGGVASGTPAGGSAVPPQMNFSSSSSSTSFSSSSSGQTHHVMHVSAPGSGEPPRMGAYLGDIPFPFPGFPAMGPQQINIRFAPPRPAGARGDAPRLRNPHHPGSFSTPHTGPNIRFGGAPQSGTNIRFGPGEIQVVGMRVEAVPVQGGVVMGGGIGGPGGPIITPEQQQLYQEHTQQSRGVRGSQNSTPNTTNQEWNNFQTSPPNPPPPPDDDMELD